MQSKAREENISTRYLFNKFSILPVYAPKDLLAPENAALKERLLKVPNACLIYGLYMEGAQFDHEN